MRCGAAAVLGLLLAGCGSSHTTGPDPIVSDPTPAPSPATQPETWIVWGQSNALGCAEGPGDVGRPGVEAWAGRWVPAEEPLPFMERFANYTTGLICDSGWAVTAANLMGRPVRLTGHAAAATPIQWWLDHPEAKWMIAYQGESDAIRGSARWASDFAELVAMVRQVTHPQLRVLVIGLADSTATSYGAQRSWDGLRDQQQAYAASDPLARYVTAEGLELQTDGIHLTRAGYAELASRVVQAIR
jgi:hypothetical protein